MTVRTARTVTQDEIDTYAADGVVCIRNAFDPDWIARLRTATEEVIAQPGPFGATYGTDADKGHGISRTAP